MDLTDLEFMGRVYTRPITEYEERLREWGLTGMAKVLDAGCEFGQWTIALAHLNERVAACDSDDGKIQVAQAIRDALGERKNIPTYQIAIEDLEEEPKYDGILSYSVLHITDDPASALRALGMALKPEGKLVLGGIAEKEFWEGLARLATRREQAKDELEKRHYMDPTEITRLANSLGLIVTKIEKDTWFSGGVWNYVIEHG